MPLFPTGNPVAPTGQLNLVAGCDYKAADGNAAMWTNAAGTWQNLTGATVYLVGFAGNLPIPASFPEQPNAAVAPQFFPPPLIGPVAGSVVTPTGAQQVSFDLAAANTGVRPCATPTDLYAYAIFAVLTNGDIVPLQSGPLNVMGVGS